MRHAKHALHAVTTRVIGPDATASPLLLLLLLLLHG